MIKQSAPDHVIKYCYKDNSDCFYSYLCETYEGGYSNVYKLKCSCNCKKFLVYQDAHPSIFAECCNCGKMITVYDLENYPAATKLKENFTLKKADENSVFVYVNYEYSDEYLYEDDVEFDVNDITWAKVFILNSGELIKILDDETA
ncbi:MAG: hypothetical protein HDT30_06405 [Clostridiales bacterium]|nr:hypothetical protein [Clostridiales bacterium]